MTRRRPNSVKQHAQVLLQTAFYLRIRTFFRQVSEGIPLICKDLWSRARKLTTVCVMLWLGGQLWFVMGLGAILAAGVLPTRSDAAWLGYRNDTKVGVIVQSASVVNNVVRRGKPHPLPATQEAWDWVAQADTKIVITVYDAKQPARILYQGPVLAGGTDLFFSIQLEPGRVGPRGIMLPPRVKLIQTKPLKPPPAVPDATPTTPVKRQR